MSQTGEREMALDVYLTKYPLIHISAECEHKIKEMIIKRVSKSADAGLISYVDKRTDIRDLSIGSIKGKILKPLKIPADDIFGRLDERTKQSYANIHENRNLAAHGKDINMSFDEVVRAYDDVQQVLSTIDTAINP